MKKHNQDNLTVVQHNYLMGATYDLTLDEHRLLFSAIALVNPKHPVPDELKVTAVDFAHQWGISQKLAYKQLKSARMALLKRTMTLPQRANGEIWDIPFLDGGGYQDGEGYIKLSFHRNIKQYLTDLKGNFTPAKMVHFRKLKSVHSFRILGQVIRFDYHKDGCGFYSVSVADLKALLGLKGKYERWRDFNRFVLKKAIKEINNTTNYKVVIETEKRGRKIVKINMLFTPNKQPDMFKQG